MAGFCFLPTLLLTLLRPFEVFLSWCHTIWATQQRYQNSGAIKNTADAKANHRSVLRALLRLAAPRSDFLLQLSGWSVGGA
jgi:hypothetical protein